MLDSPRQRVIVLDVAAAIFVVAGFVGLVVHCCLLNDYNASWLTPHFLSIWLTLFMLFYGLQIFYNLHLAPLRGYKTAATTFVHYCVVNIIAFLLMIGYYVGYRPDGGTWALFLIPCVGINTYLTWGRMNLAKSHTSSDKLDIDAPSYEPIGLDDSLIFAPKTPGQRIGVLVFAGFNAFLMAIAFLTIGLLMGGCFTQAHGYRIYPPRGVFVTINYPTGQAQKVMVYCTGTFNASQPTFVFDIGGGGHSSSDLYGMQFALNDAGYRVCSYDYPGCGWSDYGVDVNQPMILDKILDAINEPPPYILLGTMDGGPVRIYEYALNYPQNVKALIALDYNPGPSEMEMYKIIRNYTDAEALSYAVSTITGRYALGNIIRGIAVQWGLMSIFAPAGTTYVPAALQNEKLFLNDYNEKQWQTQTVLLAEQIQVPDLLFTYDVWATNRTLNANIPVFWFYNNVNITRECLQDNYTPTTCTEAAETQNVYYPYIVQATNMTVGSKLIVYEDATNMLSQGAYIPWTIQQILTNVPLTLA